MKLSKNKLAVVLLSFILSYFIFFVFGSLSQVLAYDPLASIKLELARFVILIVGSLGIFYLLQNLLTLKKRNILLLTIASIIAFISPQLLANLTGGHLIFFDYVETGAFLRDVHGINWFYMDISGFSIFSLLLYWLLADVIIFKFLSVIFPLKIVRKK